MFQIKMVLEETLAGSNSDAVTTTLRQHLCYFKMTLPLLQDLQKISPDSSVTLSHIVESFTNDSLRCHIQVGRLPVQGICLGLVTQPVISGSM